MGEHRCNPAEIITDGDYAYDLALLVNILTHN